MLLIDVLFSLNDRPVDQILLKSAIFGYISHCTYAIVKIFIYVVMQYEHFTSSISHWKIKQ